MTRKYIDESGRKFASFTTMQIFNLNEQQQAERERWLASLTESERQQVFEKEAKQARRNRLGMPHDDLSGLDEADLDELDEMIQERRAALARKAKRAAKKAAKIEEEGATP